MPTAPKYRGRPTQATPSAMQRAFEKGAASRGRRGAVCVRSDDKIREKSLAAWKKFSLSCQVGCALAVRSTMYEYIKLHKHDHRARPEAGQHETTGLVGHRLPDCWSERPAAYDVRSISITRRDVISSGRSTSHCTTTGALLSCLPANPCQKGRAREGRKKKKPQRRVDPDDRLATDRGTLVKACCTPWSAWGWAD